MIICFPHALRCLRVKAEGCCCLSLTMRHGTNSQPQKTSLIRPQMQKQIWLVGILLYLHLRHLFSQMPTFSHQRLQIPILFLLAASVSFSSIFIFFAYTFCFSFREPLPTPAIWFCFKQSVACADAAGGVPGHDRLLMGPLEFKLLPGRSGLRFSCGRERGFQKKVQGRPHTSLVPFD